MMDFRREIVIATSPQRVWRTLTNPHELTRWACESVESTTNTYMLCGPTVLGGRLGGEVQEKVEGRYLRFDWPLNGVSTEVSLRLDAEPQMSPPSANFTRVTVEHRNVPDEFQSSDILLSHETLDVHWIMWLRRLALWAERAQSTGQFTLETPLGAIVERMVVVEADISAVWRYLTEPELRGRWFSEPLGREVDRVDRNRVAYEWTQDVGGIVTFQIEPMSEERTLVMVRHDAVGSTGLFEYHIGWQDSLLALARTAARPLIRQTIWIAASPEQVWTWFTSESAMRQWWNENTVYEPRIGGRIEFSDHGAHLHGRVTELSKPRRFSFTFVEEGTEGDRDPYLVTFDLQPEDGGTRVFITQSGFDRLPDGIRDRVFGGFQRGWAESPELDRLAIVSSTPS